MRRLAFVAALIVQVLLSRLAFAGGPLNVAGVSGFQTGLAGTPITWNNGQVSYYTDQGDLSTLLPGTVADQFVAEAFSRWTSISTTALHAERTGALAEDVNGTNVFLLNGTLSLPTDVQSNSSKPVAIVYDFDGHVTDTLLGEGAGAPELCSTNSVYASVDQFTNDAHIAHALIIINGNCATVSSQLPVLKYRLVRALGRVLGLDYSQLNDNVVFGSPPPGVDDYAGFPVMHPIPVLCSEANCLPNADVPRMDDRAAISRLYPVTAANLSSNPGKSIFHDTTGRINGSVRFPKWNDIIGQGMQGVNVVARMVDPVTNRVSRSYAASSVSGFLFRGDAGNPITGFYRAIGQRRDMFGSDDPALEGYFDLGGLEVPDGYSSVVYELSVEPLNALYVDSTSVGPYRTESVAMSGTASSIRLRVERGGEVEHDITVQGGPNEPQDRYEPNSYASPSMVPSSGNWVASLSGYGDIDYMCFAARANRKFTFDVIALDAEGHPSESKIKPVVAVWPPLIVGEDNPFYESYFNSNQVATTRIELETPLDGIYKLGVADARGDGRPDFRYEAKLLYADAVTPARASVQGGTVVTVDGIGLSGTLQVQIGHYVFPVTSNGSNQLIFATPAMPDGAADITIVNPETGSSTVLESALRVGGKDARIVLLGGSNPQVPVGTQAPNPFRVQVVDSYDGGPVSGATVKFSVPATASIVGCDQSICTVYTDQNGIASVYVLIKAEGASVIQASLPLGGSTAVTINGMAATLEITLDHSALYLASGSTTTIPMVATVVVNGVPASSYPVNFLLNSGSATIALLSTQTDSSGAAHSSVSVVGLSSDVNISACVAPANAPCRTLVIHAVAPPALNLQRISGDQQLLKVGQHFAPLTLRVVDSNGNAVSGAAVSVLAVIYRAANDPVRRVSGEVATFTRDEPVVLSSSSVTLVTDNNGLVSIPINNVAEQPVFVQVQVRAGVSEAVLTLRSVWDSTGNPVVPSITNSLVTLGHKEPIRSTEASPGGLSGSVVSIPSPILMFALPRLVAPEEEPASEELGNDDRHRDNRVAEEGGADESVELERSAEVSDRPVPKRRDAPGHHADDGKGHGKGSKSQKVKAQ